MQFICANFRIPFKPIRLGNLYDCYSWIEKEDNIFKNVEKINQIRNITAAICKLKESTDDVLTVLRQQVFIDNALFLNEELLPLLDRAFDEIQNRFRVGLWGFVNPNIKFECFMNQRIKEIIIDENDEIQHIDYPKFGGNVEIDETLRKFAKKTSEFKLRNYGYSNLSMITCGGEMLHQLSYTIYFLFRFTSKTFFFFLYTMVIAFNINIH